MWRRGRFDHWLKDRDTGILDGPPIRYWMPGADQWRTAPRPPPGARHRELALRADGLSDDEGTLGQRSYRCLGTGLNHVPADPAAKPPSQLTWTSAPLDTDVDMVLASDDQSKGAPAIMEFRHAPRRDEYDQHDLVCFPPAVSRPRRIRRRARCVSRARATRPRSTSLSRTIMLLASPV